MYPIGSIDLYEGRTLSSLFFFFFFFSFLFYSSDLLCLKPSKSKCNASTITYLLVIFLRFDVEFIKKKKKMFKKGVSGAGWWVFGFKNLN